MFQGLILVLARRAAAAACPSANLVGAGIPWWLRRLKSLPAGSPAGFFVGKEVRKEVSPGKASLDVTP